LTIAALWIQQHLAMHQELLLPLLYATKKNGTAKFGIRIIL